MIGRRIIDAVMKTCRVQRDEAREMIGLEMEKLYELNSMGQLRMEDFNLACANLGLPQEYESFFMENLD